VLELSAVAGIHAGLQSVANSESLCKVTPISGINTST
jgi:hypothetical protein